MRALGELEAAVMAVLWDASGPARVREVVDTLAPDRHVAYTTVMTVLDNLHRKGWVLREKQSRAYIYRPAWSREEATARALRALLEESEDPDAALLYFARTASDRETALLREALDELDRER